MTARLAWRFRLDCAELIHTRHHLVYTEVGWTLEHVCQHVEVMSNPACEIPFTAAGCRGGVHHVTEIPHAVGEVSCLRGDVSAGCLFRRKFVATYVVRDPLFGIC